MRNTQRGGRSEGASRNPQTDTASCGGGISCFEAGGGTRQRGRASADRVCQQVSERRNQAPVKGRGEARSALRWTWGGNSLISKKGILEEKKERCEERGPTRNSQGEGDGARKHGNVCEEGAKTFKPPTKAKSASKEGQKAMREGRSSDQELRTSIKVARVPHRRKNDRSSERGEKKRNNKDGIQ